MPVAVECWVVDHDARHVLLVDHRWRGWVPPGGAVDPGDADLTAHPVLACVRRYRDDWEPSLSFTYAARSVRAEPQGEPGQPGAWVPLGAVWPSAFPEDRARIRAHLAGPGAPA
ncbi:NUDIX hydrolase [Cellulomonas triticagri]|uniref:NUDIX hydrolase n=1 Tax=Cellulomonas triticagri TaxID=2483352 RepID=A0A3M2JSL8_9CELL|nr:NUDIX hydrolase [Cellulomonas triticagri]